VDQASGPWALISFAE